MSTTKKKLEPHPVDVFTGKRVRQLRQIEDWTERDLAEEIGVKYQQLQKYESAANRISMSRLYLICEALGTTIPEFFTEFYSRRRKKGRAMKMLEGAEAVKLAGLFFKMSPEKHRHLYETGKSLVKMKRGNEGDATVSDKPAANPTSHPVDIYVGRQIWQFRIVTNMTQKQLSEKIGVIQQQIQKYEEATNRVSVSKIYLICEAFGMSIPEFFADLYRKGKRKGIMEMLESEEGTKLAGLFFRMSPDNHKHLIGIGKKLLV